MNTYSDNQTGHLYVIKSNDKVKISNLNGSDKFSIVISDSNNNPIYTTDVIEKKHILKHKINTVEPIYFRKWTVKALTAAPVADTLYSLYFYLENMQGFGMQDRWDIAATYKAKTGDTIATVMTALKDELVNKISAVGSIGNFGPIANDFIVELDGSNNIIVKENPASKTYTHNDTEILMGAAPYEYDLTLSTYDGNGLWGGNPRRINAENTTTVRFAAGVVVKDMENFFARNRADLYSLSPNFNTSIVNDLRAESDQNYIMYNMHYAFSDGLGFTYFSEKDLNLAVDLRNADAITELGKIFGTELNGFDSFGYIYDEASWRDNYWRLADYFAAEHAAGRTPGNETSWNNDGWLIFNFPAGKYAGKTISPKYDNNAIKNVSATGTTSYAIYSVTDSTDMGGYPVSDITTFDTNKVEFAVA